MFDILKRFLPQKEVAEKAEQSIFKLELAPTIVSLPKLSQKTEIDVRYPLIPPYAYVHIFWDKEANELVYFVEEPKLDAAEKAKFEIVENGLKEILNISFINLKSQDAVVDYMEKNLRIILSEFKISITKETFLKFMYYIYRNFIGLDLIEPIMRDYFIEDIECNGVNTPLYVVHRAYRNMRTNLIYTDQHELRRFIEKLAQKCGKYVSYASPVLDGKLPTGDRVNATYSEEISARGATFSIRKFTKEPWTPIKLMDFRTVSPEILAYLWLLIEYEANILIIGATGSGKTSFLNSIAFFIPPAARVVSIEETRELNLLHENWLPSVSRAAYIGGKGEVSMFDLLKSSFRQRPDYVIVGEIRGEEAFVLFQGASAGHPVMSTMHAESVNAVIRRLETRPINLQPSLIESLDVVCIMINTNVGGVPVRRLKEVAEVLKVMEDGSAETNTPFVRDPATDRFYFKTDSKVFEKISVQHGIDRAKLNKEFRQRTVLLMGLYKRKTFGFKEVQDIINAYYKDPATILGKYGMR